jgi:hypothetical protein
MTTKSNADCNTALCQYDSATRTKFFNGMLLSDEHLRAEQLYHREALKRLNRYMWGAGIVCGLEVEKIGFCLKVHPGFALDCEGNAIEVCRCITIDLADLCKDRFPGGCAPAGKGEVEKCLTIRYKEIDDGSVAVTTSGDECTGGAGRPRSQASRVREGFCLEFSDKCPEGSCTDDDASLIAFLKRIVGTSGIRQAPDGDECMRRTPECPECDCEGNDCGVCLASIKIDCEKRTVLELKGDCRRYVWTAQLLRRLASPATTGVGTQYATTGVGTQGETDQEVGRMRRAFEERQEQAPPSTPGRGRKGSGTSRQTGSSSGEGTDE